MQPSCKWSTSEHKVLGTGENGKRNSVEKISCRARVLPNTAPLKSNRIDFHAIPSDRIE